VTARARRRLPAGCAALTALLPLEAAAAPETITGLRVLEVLAGLAAVLAVVLVLAALLRRVNLLKPAGGGRLKILETLPLGTREKLVLVEVDGEPLLIGLAPGRIEALHRAAGSGAASYQRVQRAAMAELGQGQG